MHLHDLAEFSIALIIIIGLVASVILGRALDPFLVSVGSVIVGFYFGNKGTTNGAYKAGEKMGYRKAMSEIFNSEEDE